MKIKLEGTIIKENKEKIELILKRHKEIVNKLSSSKDKYWQEKLEQKENELILEFNKRLEEQRIKDAAENLKGTISDESRRLLNDSIRTVRDNRSK